MNGKGCSWVTLTSIGFGGLERVTQRRTGSSPASSGPGCERSR